MFLGIRFISEAVESKLISKKKPIISPKSKVPMPEKNPDIKLIKVAGMFLPISPAILLKLLKNSIFKAFTSIDSILFI